MINSSPFAELEMALSIIISQGFRVAGGRIYLFDKEKRFFRQLNISTAINVSLEPIEDLILSDAVSEKISNYTQWMLETKTGWQVKVPQQIADTLGITDHNKQHLALDLTDGYSCLSIFSGLQPETVNPGNYKEQDKMRLLKLGLSNYLQKLDIDKLKSAFVVCRTEVSRYKQLLANENYPADGTNEKTRGEGMNRYGEAMQQVARLVEQVAFSSSTVLILGETGTGKELIAKAIHRGSARKDEVMIKVNCAALPVNLIESELFGHERGSFTGALSRHIGKFELAENGTLFLDEIGELPAEVQAKVLRAIQEREIERIGGKTPVKVNVRIIAATNRNLINEVNEGRFRSDLYYRLNVFPITLPNLRERKEDIEELANQFIKKFARAAGKKVQAISERALHQMMAYDWPGNVRELEHLVERSVLLATGTVIKKVHLPPVDGKLQVREQGSIKTLEQNERDHILFALRKTNGKIYGKGGAAELLGINFNTLNSRIRKLGIQKSVFASVSPTA
jgi:transcriptional regulator with GAF, ATPase, and Fis domain